MRIALGTSNSFLAVCRLPAKVSNEQTGGLTQRVLVGDFIACAISECELRSNPTETSEFVRRRTANSPECVFRWPDRYDVLASQTVAVGYNASWSCHCTGYPPRRDLFPCHPIFTGFIDRQKPVGGRGSPCLAAPDFACSRCSAGCCWPIRPRSPCSREMPSGRRRREHCLLPEATRPRPPPTSKRRALQQTHRSSSRKRRRHQRSPT